MNAVFHTVLVARPRAKIPEGAESRHTAGVAGHEERKALLGLGIEPALPPGRSEFDF
jgi:hypothetical protein